MGANPPALLEEAVLISFAMFPPPLARLTWKRREAEPSRASVGGDTAG